DEQARLVMAGLNRQGRVGRAPLIRRVVEHDINQAVERHRRKIRIQRLRIDIKRNRETGTLPHLLDLDVTLKALQFILQRPDDGAGTIEDEPQEIRELADDPIRSVGVRVDESRNRIERCVEEFRLKLSRERTKPGLGELGFELRDLEGAFMDAVPELERIAERSDRAIRGEAEIEVAEILALRR